MPANQATCSHGPLQIIGQLSGITFELAITGSVFLNGALRRLEAILPTATSDQLQQLIAGTSSALLDSLDASTCIDVLSIVVMALRKMKAMPSAKWSCSSVVLILQQLRSRVCLSRCRLDLWRTDGGKVITEVVATVAADCACRRSLRCTALQRRCSVIRQSRHGTG